MDVREFRLKLYPKNFKLVREFYENTLGFTVIHKWDRPGSQGVMFQVGTTVLELLTPEGEYKSVQGADVSWEVASVHELWAEVGEKLSAAHPLRHNEWGDTSFAVYDPEGFKITFFTKD